MDQNDANKFSIKEQRPAAVMAHAQGRDAATAALLLTTVLGRCLTYEAGTLSLLHFRQMLALAEAVPSLAGQLPANLPESHQESLLDSSVGQSCMNSSTAAQFAWRTNPFTYTSFWLPVWPP